jgi:hypothetical protein
LAGIIIFRLDCAWDVVATAEMAKATIRLKRN